MSLIENSFEGRRQFSLTWIDALKGSVSKSDLPLLPESFIFGVATADHQCEAYDPMFMDIRDVWERVRYPNAMRKNATDFWNRYAEDIELAQKLGCKAFRFSISWSRVEPEPAVFNQAALDHYGDLVDKIIECQMMPIITLHHFTWPLHVERRGGMLSDNFPDIFADYVNAVSECYGQKVPYWITFNEPNLLIGGYLKPFWDTYYSAPPGMPAGTTPLEEVEAVSNLIRNLFMAHKKAYEIIKAKNPNAKVGVNQYCFGLPGWLQQLTNKNATSIKNNEDLLKQMRLLAERRDLIRGGIIGKVRANTIDKNRVDVVIATLTQTPERESLVMFSRPYFVASQQLLVRRETNTISSKDLHKKGILVVKGSTSENDITKLLPGTSGIVVSNYEAAIQALDHGDATALLSDNAILYGLMEQHPNEYRIIEEQLTDNEMYSAAVAKGDTSLLNILDAVVQDFNKSERSATWNKHYEQLSGHRPQEPPKISRSLTINNSRIMETEKLRTEGGSLPKAISGTTLRRIQDRGYVVIAVRKDVPGFGFRDPKNGILTGREIDLARATAMRIFGNEGHVRLQVVDPEKRVDLLQPPLSFLNSFIQPFNVLSTILAADWWYLGMANKLDEFLCPKECTGKMDFVGLDYYWGISNLRLDRIQRLIDAAYKRFDQAPVWPRALYLILKNFQEMFPEKSLFIFENGSVEVADNIDRATYIHKHIAEVQRAVNDGINVDGYICWSLTSNREWDLEFSAGSDFGLFHIDLDRDPLLQRGPFTAAAVAYQQIIRDRTT